MYSIFNTAKERVISLQSSMARIASPHRKKIHQRAQNEGEKMTVTMNRNEINHCVVLRRLCGLCEWMGCLTGLLDWRYSTKLELDPYEFDDGAGMLTTPPTNPNQTCKSSSCDIVVFSAWISFSRSTVRQG